MPPRRSQPTRLAAAAITSGILRIVRETRTRTPSHVAHWMPRLLRNKIRHHHCTATYIWPFLHSRPSILQVMFIYSVTGSFQLFGTAVETYFCRLAFSASRKNTSELARLLRISLSVHYNSFYSKRRRIMKTLKVVLLMAVMALGLAGTAAASQSGCCGSDDCCASCSGTCR